MPKKILVSARRGPTLKLADDLYLAADGRFHRLAPPGAGILDAGPGLDLTEATKASLDGTTLAGLTNQLGTLKPLGAEDAGMSLTEMATHLGIPARVQNLVGTAYNFAAAMSVAVAGYQFVVSLLEWQGILKKKDVVSEIRNTTNAIYATLIEGLWGQRRVEIANWMTQAVGAADILKSYMESPTDGWRDELKQRDKGVGDACTALLDRAYQTIPYYPREHDQKEWVWGLPWLEVPPSVAGQLQPGQPDRATDVGDAGGQAALGLPPVPRRAPVRHDRPNRHDAGALPRLSLQRALQGRAHPAPGGSRQGPGPGRASRASSGRATSTQLEGLHPDAVHGRRLTFQILGAV